MKKQTCTTIKELKRILSDWSETNHYGEDTEVWIAVGDGHSARLRQVIPLNFRQPPHEAPNADILLEVAPEVFDEPV